MKYEKKSYDLNSAQFEKVCEQLNTQLEGRKFLVGDEISVADSSLALALKLRVSKDFFTVDFFDEEESKTVIHHNVCDHNSFLNQA